MYTVYHLPQLKKVGCTKNFARRMKEQDVEPLDKYRKSVHDTIEEASLAEEVLRKYYGYKEDSPMTYLEKFKTKSIQVNGSKTIQKISNTPSVGWNELHIGATKEQLRNDFSQYETIILGADKQLFNFSPDQYDALVKKAKASQYKDFYWQVTTLKAIKNDTPKQVEKRSKEKTGRTIEEFEKIREWATERGLYEKGDVKTQYLKLQEEAGEVARAILKKDQPEIIDGLGDILVVLINLSHLAGYRLEECLAAAYEVINKRKGKMINGTFEKDED